MKTRIIIKNLQFGLAVLFLMMFSVTGYSQCAGNLVQMSVANLTAGTNTIDFDVVLTNTSTNTIKVAASVGSVTFNLGLIPAGSPTITFTVIDQPTASDFPGFNAASPAYTSANRQFRWTNNPVSQASAVDLPTNVAKKFARFRVTSSIAFTPNFATTFTMSPAGGATTQCQAAVYCAIPPAALSTSTTTLTPQTNPVTLVLGGPYNFTVNPASCPTGALTSQTAVTCFGGNNGTAKVTLTGTATSASYTVDGGASTPATLVSNAFTVSGLTAGTHSIVVSTLPGTCVLTAIPVTIAGPSGPLTNTTTQTACDSYTWSVNGQTYNTSGTYTGTTTNGNGCTVNESLVLTINHSDAHTTTTSACDTYTWAAPLGNGQTYTASTTVTNVTTNASGCPHTETLALTINNSDAHTTTTSACDTYTWAAPLGNGQTYTANTTVSNTSTNASGCSHVETLVLTINHSSTSTDTQTACNSYTWPANNQTYTASGTYTATTTNASGCPNAATLVLTINTATTPYYADTDGDGFGAGTAIFSCTGQPVGTVLVAGDCAPTDPTKWRSINLYVDADNDGYYNGNPETTAVCYGATVPSGYTATIIGTDCDDNNAEANPNHVEIPANGIDDNCDGSIDETGPSIGLVVSQCGSTLSNVAATIYANQAAGAQGYRFEVTSGANVRTYDSTVNSFSLMNLAGGVTYGTTYAIRVAVKTNGFWRSYSAACNITTPSAPDTTNVIASQCGSTLANIANLIYCNQVTAANQYRFEVTDVANTSNVRTYDSAVNRFALSNLAGGGAYGATYAIRVALRFGTTWEPYGTSCNVSTPATPGITNLISSQCGVTISSQWATLYANQVADAQGYRFEVTNGATTRFYDTTVNRFALGNLAGGAAANTVYTVRVSVRYNSVYGTFGSACTVTTSAGFSRMAAQDTAGVFAVKSYPNPFAESFRLDINTSSESGVELKVYDMIGKLVESRQVNISEIGSVELGSRYSSGVYNVIVTQGEHVETLRVIKR